MSGIITHPFHQKYLITVAAIGMFLDGLDGSIVNIILPQISESYIIDTGTVSWVIITYLLMMAGLILIFGKSAERGNIRRIFLCGILVFTVGSAACGLSPDFRLLLGFRILQGIGAAMIASTASLLCVTYLPRNILGMSLGAISMAVSLGVAAGPAIGGFIAQYLSWHFVFLINIPVGLVILPIAMYVIPGDNPGKAGKFDLFGAVMLFGMMAFGVYVLERIPHLGVGNPEIIFCTGICIICSAAFIIRELTARVPLINIGVFTVWRFSAVFLAFLIMSSVFMGIMYLLPFFLQAGMHFDSVMSGLYLLIPPVITVIIGIPIGRWSDRTGRRPFALTASLIMVAISCIYLVILSDMEYILLVTSLILMGLFWGFAGGPVASRVVDLSPDGEEGTGSSLMVTAVYLGSVIGTAVYAMIFTLTTADGGIVAFSDLDLGTFMNGFHNSMMAGVVLSVIAFVLSAVVRENKKSLKVAVRSSDE